MPMAKQSGALQGVRAWFVDRGQFSSKQLQLLERKIAAQGGEVVVEFDAAPSSHLPTHAIFAARSRLPSGVDPADLKARGVSLVVQEWVPAVLRGTPLEDATERNAWIPPEPTPPPAVAAPGPPAPPTVPEGGAPAAAGEGGDQEPETPALDGRKTAGYSLKRARSRSRSLSPDARGAPGGAGPGSGFQLAVMGSRELDRMGHVRAVLDRFIGERLGGHPPASIITGGTEGCDILAAAYARERGIKLQPIRPFWRDKAGTFYPGAAFERNATIVNECDEMVAFPKEASDDSEAERKLAAGTLHVVQKALQSGKRVEVHPWAVDKGTGEVKDLGVYIVNGP